MDLKECWFSLYPSFETGDLALFTSPAWKTPLVFVWLLTKLVCIITTCKLKREINPSHMESRGSSLSLSKLKQLQQHCHKVQTVELVVSCLCGAISIPPRVPVHVTSAKTQHWPYRTGLYLARYHFRRMVTLPLHRRGFVPERYFPLHFPSTTPFSSLLLTWKSPSHERIKAFTGKERGK